MVFIGTIIPRKGVDFLLDAWEQVQKAVPEAELILLNNGKNR